jgi:excisionase family DNA binding protein
MESILLTVQDVMNRLQIGRKTLYSLTKSGKVKSVKIGGSVRYEPEEIDRFIKESRTKREDKVEPAKVV